MNPNASNGGANKTCLWGNYVMAIFILSLLFVLLYEYRDMNTTTQENNSLQVVPSLSSTERTEDVLFHDHVTQCSYLSTAKQSLQQAQAKIATTWNITSYPLFLHMMHIPTLSWDIQKAKLIKLLLEADDVVSAAPRPSFVVGFTGSSVTAGHDSYFYEAYPQVFHDTMKPVMDSLKINFTVRNHAIGNNPCYPYDACVETHVGDDVDLITWEQSMNCGRDSKPVETFTRSAHYLPKKPSVLYVVSGTPSWAPADCDKLNITNTSARPIFTSKELESLQTPLKTIVDRTGSMPGYTFLRDVHDRYQNLALTSQEVFAIQNYKCYGPYSREFSVKTLGGGAPWHPGRLGHKIRGENLAFMLLAILEDAIDTIGNLACTTGFADGSVFDKSKLESLPHLMKLLSSVRKQRRQLSTAAAVAPTTSTTLRTTTTVTTLESSTMHEITQGVVQDMKQAFNLTESFSKQVNLNSNVLKFADKKFSSGSPLTMKDVKMVLHHMMHQYAADYLHAQYNHPLPSVPADLSETANPSQCYTDYAPRVKNPLEDIILSPKGNWTKEISFFDVNGVRKSEANHLGYLDRKILYISHEVGASLSFHLKIRHESPVWICECQKGFLKYPDYMSDLIDGAEVKVQYNVNVKDSNHKPHVDLKQAKKVDLVLLKDQCYRTTTKLPVGDHILTVTQKGPKQINIAYVVTW